LAYKLEIIGFDINGCIAAAAAGAHRIEICANPLEGGTTPSYGLIKEATNKISVPINIMIRPRGGNFVYNDEEFKVILSEIKVVKVFGCSGIVCGILKPNGSVDKERMKKVVAAAHPLPVTFHRAFDRANNLSTALEDVIDTGCKTLLTSGGKNFCFEALPTIKTLVEQANNRITIMPGSGITSKNIIDIVNQTGAAEYHASAKIKTQLLPTSFDSIDKQDFLFEVDKQEVQEILVKLNYINPN
jgi:copper homeostasis protein